MSLHDWTRVTAGLFHDFRQSWSIRLKDALNAGRLPKGIVALVEQKVGPRESDVLVRARLAPSAGGFFSPERTADFCPRGPDVDVGNSAVTSDCRKKQLTML